MDQAVQECPGRHDERPASVPIAVFQLDTDHPTLGRIKTLGTPVKLSDTPLTPGRPAPMLGQHTDEVLREIGFTIEDIAKLRGS